jgi:hypothetical protein
VDLQDGGSPDILAVAAGPGGEPLWTLALRGGGTDTVSSAAALPDGGLALAGSTGSSDGDFSWRPSNVRGLDTSGLLVMLSPPRP